MSYDDNIFLLSWYPGETWYGVWRSIVLNTGHVMATPQDQIELYFPALFVHLWLPLLLIGASLNFVLRTLLRAVKFAEWFISHGEDHPLDAIGMIASVLVFAVAFVIKAAQHLSR
jgi:hypothetical protein